MAGVRLEKSMLELLIREMPDRIETALDEGGDLGVTMAQNSFGSRLSGRGAAGGKSFHAAGNVGDPPNVRSGRYRASIRVDRRADGSRSITTDVFYALFLEFGTSGMGARPVFGPMSVRLAGQLPAIFQRMMGLL